MKVHSHIKAQATALLLLLASLFITACQQIASQPGNKFATSQPHVKHISFRSDEISISFNQDMVRFGQGDDALLKLPITITPEVKCLWYWHSSRGISCSTYEDQLFKPATIYGVQVHEGLFAADGQPLKTHQQQFETPRPEFRGWEVNQWLSPVRPELYLTLSHDVDIDSVRQKFTITDAKRRPVKFTLTDITDINQKAKDKWDRDDTARVLKVSMSQDLLPGGTYRVAMLPGLKSTVGPLRGQKKTHRINTFTTWGDFKYTGAICTKKVLVDRQWVDDVIDMDLPCPHGYQFKVQFSAPLERKHNTAVFKYLDDSAHNPSWLIIHKQKITMAAGSFTPETQVPLNIPAELQDIFGRKLINPQQFTLNIGDALPNYDLDRWVGVYPMGSETKMLMTSINEPDITIDTMVLGIDRAQNKP
ncbi:MAG: hypothetical protein MJK04_17070, partial [Psychrosphaera sp.]|nr:hypothetical protein [Psychrosphaera sp.]